MTIEQPPIEPMEDVNPESYPTETEGYFSHYDLDCGPEVQHWFGSFSSGKYTLAAHLYRPAHYEATILLFHGYMNHTGQFKHLIRRLLEEGYAAAVFDFPGHGLSSGERARIDDMAEYTRAAGDFLKVVRPRLHGPFHALGFSMGAAVLADLLLTGQGGLFDKVILAAPLIHWSAYNQSKNTYKIYIKFTDKITRFHQKNTSDREYLIFNKTQDYLHASHLSLYWVKALFDWNDTLDNLPACGKEILILQGDKDSTVDWQYNLDLLGRKFPNAKIEMFHTARHELFNEAIKHRLRVLESVTKYLKR